MNWHRSDKIIALNILNSTMNLKTVEKLPSNGQREFVTGIPRGHLSPVILNNI